MKLKKREITLNEADSLQDVYYMEKILSEGYSEGKNISSRKETLLLLDSLQKEGEKELEFARSLWERSKKESKISK